MNAGNFNTGQVPSREAHRTNIYRDVHTKAEVNIMHTYIGLRKEELSACIDGKEYNKRVNDKQ